MLCWVYCVQWSALVSCWQALGSSLWACCPSTPYHRSIDLLLRVPASASVPAFFMSVPVSLPPCLFPPSAPLSDPLPSFLHFYLFAAIISCVYLYHFELRCIYMQIALLFLVLLCFFLNITILSKTDYQIIWEDQVKETFIKRMTQFDFSWTLL